MINTGQEATLIGTCIAIGAGIGAGLSKIVPKRFNGNGKYATKIDIEHIKEMCDVKRGNIEEKIDIIKEDVTRIKEILERR